MHENARKQRLWVISELYFPEETSTGYYLTKIAEGLTDDFDVKVICGQPNYSARGITAPNQEVHKDVEIFRAFGTRLNKNVIPFRILNMVTLSFSIFLKTLTKFKRNDKILVVTTPPLLPFITGITSYIKKSKHILLIHDNYPEILVAVNKASDNSLLTKTINYFNKRVLNSANKIIVVGRDMKKLVSRKLAKNQINKVFVIPNWAELETVSPANRDENALIKELKLEDKVILLYAGNMGYPNDIETFLDVAENINDDIFHFIFLGAGVKKSLLVSTVKSRRLKNITILDPKPRSEQQIFLNACDIAVVSLVKKMWGVSMPSRTYNILAVGKPILALCERNSELDLVVNNNQVGWSIVPDNPDLLSDTLYEIRKNTGQLPKMGQRARNVALDKFSLDSALEKYKSVLNQSVD